MGNSSVSIIALFILQALIASHSYSFALSTSFPLSTNNRWIVDEASGQRVTLRCANWPAHMSVMLAEGLHKQPIVNIVSQITTLGLNCVRLTWATYMFTRYSNQTIQQSLDDLNLGGIKTGIINNNPNVLNMTQPQAYAFVVDQLGAHNIMVVSDNHVSEPKWCCGNDDGNTFFGDTNFDPEEWVQGHTLAAQFLKGKPNVVGISLRNELRGPLQNLDTWYENVKRGALAVHQANPYVLVIISGLNYAADLSFLKENPLDLALNDKVVYEAHNYPYWGGNWDKQPTNSLCDSLKRGLDDKVGFLINGPNPSPLFISEFGIDLIARTDPDERWLTCMFSYLAGRDIDWSWWALQGSYYLREGQVDTGEAYGLLNFQWSQPSYPQFPQRFQLALKKLQDPASTAPHSNVLYHPQSGLCVKADTNYNQVELSDCVKASGWSEEGDKIKLNGDHCLKALGDEGVPVVVSTDCSSELTSWKFISASGLHLAVGQGNGLCLDKDSTSSILVTTRCICVEDDDGCIDNPQSQWFQFVPTNVV